MLAKAWLRSSKNANPIGNDVPRSRIKLAWLLTIAVFVQANAEERNARGLKYSPPKGWAIAMKPSVISVATLTVGDVKITATPLRRPKGDLLEYRTNNINR